MSLVRYSKITEGFKREFLLLQGRGCAWRRCSFCDYHEDVSADPFSVNKEVLSHVTGEFGVLDIINSGSAMELDEATLDLTASIVREEQVHDLWFEAHWMYHMRLAAFAGRFPSCRVHFRCGVESFNGALRESWNLKDRQGRMSSALSRPQSVFSIIIRSTSSARTASLSCVMRRSAVGSSKNTPL